MKTQDRVIALQQRILAEGYYVPLWCEALVKHNISTAQIDQHEISAHKLVLLCHDFWCLLPDSPEIRRDPFFDLCDIAELIMDPDLE